MLEFTGIYFILFTIAGPLFLSASLVNILIPEIKKEKKRIEVADGK
ncbi:MAG: hypothetical protein GX846_01770 [Deltaproteobacteria bacterium]|nr:hypothetical protein [Deltaproteobacteria bacterium]